MSLIWIFSNKTGEQSRGKIMKRESIAFFSVTVEEKEVPMEEWLSQMSDIGIALTPVT